jgi:PAS domain S-box-containing protein
MMVGAEGAGVAWELNEAARHWLPTRHWRDAEWGSLARAVAGQARRGVVEADDPVLRLRWRAVPHDDGWLAWLSPREATATPELQAMREQVELLREQLHIAQEFGRLAVWARDLRSGRGHWDDRMFELFGFDAALGTPELEEALQRLHPDDRGRAREDCVSSMARPGRYEAHYRLMLAKGGVAQLHSLWDVKCDAEGEPERMVGVMIDDTESVRLAQWHQAASTQLALAVGLVGISLWRIDLATRRIQLNDWGYQLIGRTPQPGGMPLDEMRACIHPDDQDAIVRATEEAVAGIGIIDAEARYRRPDGSYRTLLTRRVAVRDDGGKAVALIGVSLDMTEQVHVRERALEATQGIELIADATGVGVWSVDLDTGASVWNRQMRRIYGLPDDAPALQAQRGLELVHPEDRDRVAQGFSGLVTGDPVADDAEFRISRPDGEVRWVVARARRAQHGERNVAFGVLIDVTEQRRTQQRLRLAEQRTLLAAQTVGLAHWERDLETGDSWWDAQMYRLRGLAADDPRSPNELRDQCIHPDDMALVEQRTAQIVQREGDYYFEFRVVWPDGTVHWLAARGTVLRDASGRAQRMTGFNWDVTDHKVNEDMRREKAAAEASSRAKSEFLARMSHELRTPLNAVLGFAQLMLEDAGEPLTTGQRQRAERVRNAGKHLLALIDDVLDLTSIEAGTLPLLQGLVPLAPVVGETLQWLAPAAERAGVSLDAPPVRGAVMGDPRRLRQVLANLLSNAVKYNRAGGRVELRVIEEPTDRWLGLRVRDTGRGLTGAQLQRLFEPFNRLGAEREGIEGTGIGLTIVRHLVERMGGRIDVDSTPGIGTTFVVWLLRAHADVVDEPTAPMALEPQVPSATESIDLLYIEDNPVNVLLVEQLVALRPGVRLHSAEDGSTGIAKARALRPHAVLIDLQLPDIDGFEVLRALRAEPSTRDLICIALSANAMPEDVQRALRDGFNDYWTKPIDFPQFLAGLDALCGV